MYGWWIKKRRAENNEMERAWKEQGNKHQNIASSVLTSCVILRYTLNLSEPKYPHLSCFYFFLMSIMSAVLILHIQSKAQLNIFYLLSKYSLAVILKYYLGLGLPGGLIEP